jgi:HlyD family type I secretion membrane fusion protein
MAQELTEPGGAQAAERRRSWLAPWRAGGAVSRARYADFLPEIEAIAERDHSPWARHLALATALFVAAALAWGSLAKIDRVATAPASVRPSGKVKIVNHPEGGMVATLYVHEGERVAEGAPLLALDARLVDQELARLTAEWQSLSAEAARLEAETADKPLAFEPALAEARPDLVAEQKRQYEEDHRALASRRQAAEEKVAQARSAAAMVAKKIAQLEEALRLSREQESVLAELAAKGYFPRLKYLALKRQVSDDEGELAQAKEDFRRAQAALSEAERQRDQTDAEHYAALLDRLTQIRVEQDRAFRGMKQQQAKHDSLRIAAPVAGIVQNLAVASAGQSVRPGEPIMNIVPVADTLLVEARVPNRDIGYVSLGQRATVKIDTYPYVKFGTLDGTVERIAPDASRDEKSGQTFFVVDVRTARTYFGPAPGEHPVNPGMQAEVDLHIGERSILGYLTDRFRQKAGSAFREP